MIDIYKKNTRLPIQLDAKCKMFFRNNKNTIDIKPNNYFVSFIIVVVDGLYLNMNYSYSIFKNMFKVFFFFLMFYI